MNNKIIVTGRLIEGYHVASGPSRDYPYGAIEKQKPFFKERGLHLDDVFNGTLNISISPKSFEMVKPQFTFEKVEWTDLHPPETFSFSRCTVTFDGENYDGWVYYPHPETKIRHQQSSSMIEILTRRIPDIHYGDEVSFELNSDEILIKNR